MAEVLSYVVLIVSWALLAGGALACVIGAAGLLRFPDVYTRMHAAGVVDTGGATLILLGLMVQGGFTLITAKLAFILFFLLFTSPTSTYALAHSAVASGLQPWTGRYGSAGRAVTVEIVNVIMLAFLAVTAVGIVRLRNLFAVVMLSSIYSLLSAAIFVVLDAVDVSFTEAAVGAGITTVLFLGTLILTNREEKAPKRGLAIAPLLLVLVTGGVLIYTTFDPRLPPFGAASAPANHHVVPEYMADNVRQAGRKEPTKVHIPNVVTTTLASYRGYDTLGETVVIFTAGISVLILLGVAGKRRRDPEDDPDSDEGGMA